METKIERQDENIVKVDIQIAAKDAVEYYNNAAKRLAQYVNIPGFRKGKAPRNIVEQHIGEERIKHEALEAALPKIFSEVISENKFDVVAQPYVESYDFKLGEDLKIVAKIELRPEVTLGEYKNATVEVEEHKLPEDAFQKSLDNLLMQSATTEVVTNRNSEANDTVVFDFEGFPLVGASDLLKKIYRDLSASTDISGKHLYAIYISFDRKMVLRNLETDKREYLQFPDMQHYVDYNIKHIEID